MNFKKLAIVVPSKIQDKNRYFLAMKSYKSLKQNFENNEVDFIVAHDNPSIEKFIHPNFYSIFNATKWNSAGKLIYNDNKTSMVIENNKSCGSAVGLLNAVDKAISIGKEYAFIHLDDHIYISTFNKLIRFGLDSMERDKSLLWTRYSGYPIIHENRKEFRFNNNGEIIFDNVSLSPRRSNEFTLWSSYLQNNVNEGSYWPIAMWFSLYRIDFLKVLLEWAIEKNKKHLANVEEYYKSEGGFNRIIDKYKGGSFGYINMQFGGFEMHRNKNWKELLKIENKELR